MRFGRLLLPLSLLALLHVYIGWRVLPDLPVPFAAHLAAGALLGASYLAMLVGLGARRFLPRPQAQRLAKPGLFMAAVFSFLLGFTVVRDLLSVVAIVALSSAHVHTLQASSAVAVVVLSAFATIAGIASARRRARIVHIDVPIANLPQALHGFSIAQISDMHVGPAIRVAQVAAIVDAVNALGADLIAVTGDVVDGSVGELTAHTAPLARLRAQHGAFFVTGNHEYYSGAGVTDFSAQHFDFAGRSDPVAALSGAPGDAAARILLAHQPRALAQAGVALACGPM